MALDTAGLDIILISINNSLNNPIENQMVFYQLQVSTAEGNMADLVGQVLMDDGMGGYFIDFVHVDDLSYSLTIQGPFGVGRH